jgi:hypothetical protein
MIYDDPFRNAFALSYSMMVQCRIRNSSAGYELAAEV